ncbi:hypothetical protein Tco_1560729 [Tanacetum coccineum]
MEEPILRRLPFIRSDNEFEEEIKEEEEEEDDDLEYFDSFPTMEELGQAYIDLESPINVMSRLNYYWIMKDATSVIYHYLGGMVLGKPFVNKCGIIYDKDEGTVMFEKCNEKITFKMPHKMEMFKHIDIEDLKTDNIPPFVIASDDSDQEKTHYSDSLNLGPEYKRDESVTKAIQCLIKMKSRTNEGGVT